ncbi:solute carrier organic anion transporter family member 1C1 isoform X4 [Sapajus apella]|uniref:Solute carrier organic anion transporter family member n=1 Tax=Sapajus apella TaxID=9515 RepID=A0A6J3FVA4_SAPAP|nr:solute carrier organic anion transporter family member 1C1 isoform X4 [Sapajus apella]
MHVSSLASLANSLLTARKKEARRKEEREEIAEGLAEHIERNWLSLISTSRSESRNVFIMDTSSKENIQLFCKTSVQPVGRPSFKTGYPSSEEKHPCCGELKVFLGALSFVYFAKALAEGYLKSTITQIERRFDIPSSLVGVIDGSFEIGNLLVITFVSYFGAKLHRPKIIGAGCLIMGVGTLLIAMPQFFMEQYKYERYSPSSNSTLSISPCLLESSSQLPASVMEKSKSKISNECEVDTSSSMWIYVFLGNLLRGIGETPIQPLGIAYLDDFASEDNAAFYIGCVQTVAIIGPIFGFLLGSLCAKLYVDIGFVNLDHITITPKDPQWVGAWWLGYLIAGILSLLAAVPFWYLPKSLPRSRSREDSNSSEKSKFIVDDHTNYQTPQGENAKIMELARDFLPSLKNLFGNPVYFLYLCTSTVQFNSLFGMVTYKPKYIEQQYGQSSSKANFVIDCNSRCKCSETKWEPMCGENGITYVSACLAGCQTSNRSGKNIIFYNCTCVGIAASKSGNSSGIVGRCQKDNGCPQMFLYFLVISVITSYTLSLGGIPGYILLLRCIKPQLKSFALGIYTLAIRVLAGIPAPVYFGVLIDTSCLKWGFKRCGSRGSCRLYDSNVFRHIYLGLTVILGTVSIFLSIAVIFILKKNYVSKHRSFTNKRERTTASTRFQKENYTTSDHLLQPNHWPGKETQL